MFFLFLFTHVNAILPSLPGGTGRRCGLPAGGAAEAAPPPPFPRAPASGPFRQWAGRARPRRAAAGEPGHAGGAGRQQAPQGRGPTRPAAPLRRARRGEGRKRRGRPRARRRRGPGKRRRLRAPRRRGTGQARTPRSRGSAIAPPPAAPAGKWEESPPSAAAGGGGAERAGPRAALGLGTQPSLPLPSPAPPLLEAEPRWQLCPGPRGGLGVPAVLPETARRLQCPCAVLLLWGSITQALACHNT